MARIAIQNPEMELKPINAFWDAEYLAYMMRYDSSHERYEVLVRRKVTP